MAKTGDANQFHLVTFDTGGVTGWAASVVDIHAFSRPEHRIRPNMLRWDCGEFTGPEEEQLDRINGLIHRAHFTNGLNYRTDIVSEDFELKQTIGGENLLSPVRMNAVIAWICYKQGLKLHLQKRQMRVNITPERLRLFGFEGRWTKTGKGKDAFAAMQHHIVWLRRLKQKSLEVPWKLSDGIVHNARWDCSCARIRNGKIKHDLIHP